MDFGSTIRSARKAAGFTQQEIADRLNVAKSTFCGYETNRTEPDLEKVCEMCILFGCSADFLLGVPVPPVDPVLVAYREAPPVLQAAICDMLHVAPPASSMSSVSTFVPGGGYERKEKSRG